MTTNNDSISNLSNVCDIEWPKACLKSTEDLFLSICCGNTTIQWAMHRARDNYDVITTSWKTFHINDDNELFLGNEFVELLDFILNQEARSFIFGNALASKEAAEEEAVKRGYDLTVYLIGSDSHQVKILSRIFSSIPCRIFLFQRKDFFSEEQGMYATMGMDRLATLRGASAICGFPALVIDSKFHTFDSITFSFIIRRIIHLPSLIGGTCLTYTATDDRGYIIGGGISPGISLRFESMTSDAPALPNITIDELKKRIEIAISSNVPIPRFARETKDAMIVGVLSEIWHSLDSMIQLWLHTTNTVTTSTIPTIFITGGSGEILQALLGVNRDKVINVLKNEGRNTIPFQIDFQPGLVHKGIAAVIANGSGIATNSSKKVAESSSLPRPLGVTMNSQSALSFVKKKVLKKSLDTDMIGSVVKVTQVNGNNLFHIRYESGYIEAVDLLTLTNLMDNYQVHEASSHHLTKKRSKDTSMSHENTERGSKSRKINGKNPTNAMKRNRQGNPPTHTSDPVVEDTSTGNRSKTQSPSKRQRNEESMDHKDDASQVKMDSMAKKAETLLERPRDLIHYRVMKYFIDEETNTKHPFYGTIDDYKVVEEGDEGGKHIWRVTYDDGDQEHCNVYELLVILKQYKNNRQNDPKMQIV